MVTKDGPLTQSQRQRGMYLGQERDIGRDPDWDLKTNTWQGKRSKEANEAAERNSKVPVDEVGK